MTARSLGLSVKWVAAIKTTHYSKSPCHPASQTERRSDGALLHCCRIGVIHDNRATHKPEVGPAHTQLRSCGLCPADAYNLCAIDWTGRTLHHLCHVYVCRTDVRETPLVRFSEGAQKQVFDRCRNGCRMPSNWSLMPR